MGLDVKLEGRDAKVDPDLLPRRPQADGRVPVCARRHNQSATSSPQQRSSTTKCKYEQFLNVQALEDVTEHDAVFGVEDALLGYVQPTTDHI